MKPVFLSSILIIVISTITLTAYFLGEWKFLGFGPGYIPMAPLTALLFLLLSILLIIQDLSLNSKNQRRIIIIGSAIIFVISFISLIQIFVSQLPDFNTWFFHGEDEIAGIPVGKISSVTAGVFVLYCLSLWTGLSRNTRIRELSSILAVIISIIGLIVVVGYWYQTPFLYGGTGVPVALTTGLGFFIGGSALIVLRKNDTTLGVSFFGSSIQAKLLRTFLPTVLLSVLIEGWVFSVLVTRSSAVNPVFWSGIIALSSMAFIAAMIIILSRQIWKTIEKAESERDITLLALQKTHNELSNAYTQLKISEDKLRILTDYTYDWELWENPTGEYVYISPSCLRISGYSAKEFYTHKNLLSEIVHPQDRLMWEEHNQTRCLHDCPISIYFRIIHRDGGVRWIHHICQSIILPSGENLGRRSSNRDVTHEKEGEIALNERNAQYQVISENSADVIWIYNLASQKLRYISPSVYKLRGFTPEEVISQSFEEMLTPESYQLVETALPQRISQFMAGEESERVQITEIYQTCKDGSIVPTEVVTTLVQDQNGNVVEIIGVSRDITERKEAEEKISLALVQIDQNLETLAVLNDQIRNPLTIMDFISEELEGDKKRILHEQVLLIDDLINQLDKGYLYSEKVRCFLAKHLKNRYAKSEEQ
ncbi:MAG: PAS domain-containing protein [Methanospirillum sp.]|nr:PAS domain-containing protein [Methanospirillum sp.]